MNSNAILDALSHLLKSPISHISEIQHNNTYYFICVGNHSFFIIEHNLKTVKAEIFYAHLQKLVVDTGKHKFLMLCLGEGKEKHVPPKMIIATENRKALAEHLRAAWKTDHMYRLGIISPLL
jgi:hypothetical protein